MVFRYTVEVNLVEWLRQKYGLEDVETNINLKGKIRFTRVTALSATQKNNITQSSFVVGLVEEEV